MNVIQMRPVSTTIAKRSIFVIILGMFFSVLFSQETGKKRRVYHSGTGEVILSGANVLYNGSNGIMDLNTLLHFTLFFHTQQMINYDLNSRLGFYSGVCLRNIGIITQERYQYMGFTGIDENHEFWNADTKIKRRSYSLGFPLALKVGNLREHTYLYAGGEYEWLFHYKQKLFIEGKKIDKEAEWCSPRVNPWIPSVFVGFQFRGGLNLKAKYYLKDFLNSDYQGYDFGEPVDYRQFSSSGIWYISLSMVISKERMDELRREQQIRMHRTALR
jgi:hypothetical protein